MSAKDILTAAFVGSKHKQEGAPRCAWHTLQDVVGRAYTLIMNFLGKIIGAILGYIVGGPYGLVMGALLGHCIDAKFWQEEKAPAVQDIFFRTTFLTLGKLAKADGVVSTDEINLTKKWMQRMQLDSKARSQAIEYFNLGKQSQFDLDANLLELKQACAKKQELLQTFIDIQWQMVKADGKLNLNEKKLLQFICQRLEINADFIETESTEQPKTEMPNLTPYQILQVPSDISDTELKKVYHRLMSQYHPDKLIAKGLPEELMQFATQKTQEIQAAYETISRQRKAA